MTDPRARRFASLILLTTLLGLAFGLRVFRLDAVPLRGDEAFAVRVWADSPATVLRDWFDREPHPLGTFLGFWAWQNVAGDSEFAMRYLALLGNLIGVAAVAALAKRLLRSQSAALWIAPIAALLWAINPFLIWHAQDVRNYAIWAGLSPLALWLFLRAADSNRPRDWTLYALAELIALYTFFLEAFFVIVQAMYLMSLQNHCKRQTITRALFVWAVIGILLIPWFIQIYLLSGSGYEGTTKASDPPQLITWFIPVLFGGEDLHAPWDTIITALWFGFFALTLWIGITRRDRVRLFLVAWLIVPMLMLLIVGSRMAVFHPRYLIALTPALLFVIISGLIRITQQPISPSPGLERRSGGEVIVRIAALLIPLIGVTTLPAYYRGDHPKAANWPALATYLTTRARATDEIIGPNPDPALGYYYRGGAHEFGLIPDVDISAQLRSELNFYDTFWLIGRDPDAEQFLHDNTQFISFDEIPGFPIMQFRTWDVDPDEMQVETAIMFGNIVHLRGYTVQGPDSAIHAITVLLYWEPIRQTDTEYKVFVHLVGPPHPGPLWDQDDARPMDGFASTRQWEIGTLYRDPYHLLAPPSTDLAPGTYTIQVGFYDPATSDRLPVFDAEGNEIGDSYSIMTFDWPLTP
ncbi:MAG: glycosyltransferase family 39 protein [Anaerolineae bacterium]|nr:glycosyltransferase family 39 protein [Anaerolineae bacterium]